MTPMIDIVFQLVIFLMLVADFTQTELARVILPLADQAVPDEDPEKKRLIVNVVHEPPRDVECRELQYKEGKLIKPCQIGDHWKIKLGNIEAEENIKLGIREVNLIELERKLIAEGNIDRKPPPRGSRLGVSDRPVMIRADAGAPFSMIRKVMEACGRAKIWKMEFGATNPVRKKP